MANKDTLILSPLYDDTNHICTIKDLEQNIEACHQFAAENSRFVEPINDEITYKLTYKERTTLNRKLNLIKSTRISVNDIVMSEFNNGCKQLEDILSQAIDEHTKVLKEWDAKKVVPLEKPVDVRLKVPSLELLDKLLKYLDKNEIPYEIHN